MADPGKVILVGGFPETVELCSACGLAVAGIIGCAVPGTDIPVLGADEDASSLAASYKQIPLFLTPDLPAVRRRLAGHFRKAGFTFRSLVHPSATRSSSADMGEGVMVQDRVSVSTGSVLGDFVRLNIYATVSHDVTIGDYSTVGPAAVLLGRVTVGQDCYIGGNATILPGRNIGDGATVGAGAVVTRDVPDGVTVAGNPARVLRSE